MKPDKVKMTEKQSDSGSDSSWFVQDVGEAIEEAEVKCVTGDGLNEEDTGLVYPEKSSKINGVNVIICIIGIKCIIIV